MSDSFIDLAQPAANGLARGMTTGSCATAAAKAALSFLLFKEKLNSTTIDLPSGEKLRVDIDFCRETKKGAMAQVTKDAGDDPDVTHRCHVEVEIRKNDLNEIFFVAGDGVGTVTEEGLQIPKGEPAINPVPRKMIINNLKLLMSDSRYFEAQEGLDVVISIPGGKELSAKTFNPRLGVEGGISILGTTGIVEPMSISAWKSSIEAYINVAVAANSDFIVFSPGRWGQNFFHEEKKVPLKRICIISNFIGFAINDLKQKYIANPKNLKTLVLAGHPGKLAKIIDGHWNTHSSESPSALPTLLEIADSLIDQKALMDMKNSRTVEHLIQLSNTHNVSATLFNVVAEKISDAVSIYLDGLINVEVYLAGFKGNLVGQAAPLSK
jgi:cobalt-precorrin-5B (C1)-methyltransferase